MMTCYGSMGFMTALLVESSLQFTIMLMVYCSQSLLALQSDIVLSHLRNLNLKIHRVRIGELLHYSKFYVLNVDAPTEKICHRLTTTPVPIQNPLG